MMRRFREGRRERAQGCVEHVCRPEMRHRPCIHCGGLTDYRAAWVDPATLRRTVPYRCGTCVNQHSDADARRRRTERDWTQVTDPLRQGALSDTMREQYDGRSRQIVRAFMESDSARATVTEPDVQAGMLNDAIRSLGLQNDLYVEQRATTTVLRRIEPSRRGGVR